MGGRFFFGFEDLLGKGSLTAGMNLTRDKKTKVTAVRFRLFAAPQHFLL